MAKDSFWVMADEKPLGIAMSFERVDEDKHHVYQALFEDHLRGEGIIVDPRLILRMRLRRQQYHGQISVLNLRLIVINSIMLG